MVNLLDCGFSRFDAGVFFVCFVVCCGFAIVDGCIGCYGFWFGRLFLIVLGLVWGWVWRRCGFDWLFWVLIVLFCFCVVMVGFDWFGLLGFMVC